LASFINLKNSDYIKIMKYFIGIAILLLGIYIITDLALKTRYTRKRLSKEKNKSSKIKY